MSVIKDNITKKSIIPKLALFSAAFIWGSSFIIVKDTVDTISPIFLIAIRFTFASLLLSLCFHKKLKMINKEYIWQGSIIGFFIFGAYAFQTIGITDTTPGKNAFLTSIYCVIVPFLYWIVNKTKPTIYNFMAAFLCVTGIGLISLNGSFGIGYGDALTMGGGIFFALHMVAVTKFSRIKVTEKNDVISKDAVLLTILQFAFGALFSWILFLLTDKLPSVDSILNIKTLFSILYLALFCTTIALLFQNIGQKHTDPAPAAIIMSLESVLGVIMAVIFYGEKLSVRLIIGFVLVFVAILFSEIKPSLSFVKTPKYMAKLLQKYCHL